MSTKNVKRPAKSRGNATKITEESELPTKTTKRSTKITEESETKTTKRSTKSKEIPKIELMAEKESGTFSSKSLKTPCIESTIEFAVLQKEA